MSHNPPGIENGRFDPCVGKGQNWVVQNSSVKNIEDKNIRAKNSSVQNIPVQNNKVTIRAVWNSDVKNFLVQKSKEPSMSEKSENGLTPLPPCQKSDFDVKIFVKENTLLKKRFVYENYFHIWKVRKSKKNTSLDYKKLWKPVIFSEKQ